MDLIKLDSLETIDQFIARIFKLRSQTLKYVTFIFSKVISYRVIVPNDSMELDEILEHNIESFIVFSEQRDSSS